MIRKSKISYMVFASILSASMILTGCGKNSSEKANTNIESEGSTSTDVEDIESVERFSVVPEYKDSELETDYDISEAIDITLKDDESSCSSDNVEINGNSITIKSAGIYVLTGTLTDGNIVVDSEDDEKVRLILDNVNIKSSTTSPLYIKNSKKTIITLTDGTENTFEDTDNYELEDEENKEPNATIYSKDDLVINGTGTLSVKANYNHGIQSTDDLKIISGDINVTSVGDAIVGKDSVVIKEGDIQIDAQQHGIKSTNYSQDKGYIYIGNANIDIKAEEDGINGATCTRIEGGNITIAAGDDGIHSDVDITVDSGNIVITESCEGIESQYITINDGNIDLVSSDDGFNASSGSSGDDFMNFDMKFDMNGKMSEDMQNGIDGEKPDDIPENAGGEAPDDIPENAGGEVPDDVPDNNSHDFKGNMKGGNFDDSSDRSSNNTSDDTNGDMKGGKMAGGNMAGGVGLDTDENCYLIINGGTIKVSASGDGLDSNGYIEINGGEVYVDGPTSGADGALDYGISCKVTGGILVAAGSVGMAVAPTEESTQYSVNAGLSSSYEGGTNITVKDESGNTILEYAPTKQFQSFVFSTGELKEGETYTIYADDTQDCTFTVSDITTTAGNTSGGMGGLGKMKR